MFFGDAFSSNRSRNKDGMSPVFFVVAFEVLAGAAWKAWGAKDARNPGRHTTWDKFLDSSMCHEMHVMFAGCGSQTIHVGITILRRLSDFHHHRLSKYVQI